ncbi:MAG: ATP-binding protein [Verrucomicrobiota bacterium]
MFTPPITCPNPACKHHGAPAPGWYAKKGYYRTKFDRQPVPRYRCKACGRYFGSHTGTATYRQHKPKANALIANLLCSGVTMRRIRDAAFPVVKTLESFDFGARPSINQALVRELVGSGEYMVRKENILLVGNPGTGKTHLPTALGFAACGQGKRVRFTSTTALVTQLLEMRETRTLQRLQKQLERLDLLILEQFTKNYSRVLGRRRPLQTVCPLGCVYKHSRCGPSRLAPAFGAPKPLATFFCKML